MSFLPASLCLCLFFIQHCRCWKLVAVKRKRCLCNLFLLSTSPCPWAWHKLQLSPAAQLADRNPSLFWDLAKSSSCSAPVGAGVRLALPSEYSESKDKPLLMVPTNDLYILIRNAWVKITRWNLNEQRKAYLLFLCFSTTRKSNKLTWIRSEQISRKLIRNLWFSPSWKYQIFPLQSQENMRLAKGIIHRGLFSLSLFFFHSHTHTFLFDFTIANPFNIQKPKATCLYQCLKALSSLNIFLSNLRVLFTFFCLKAPSIILNELRFISRLLY